ncbi:Nonribosomal peptide synthase agiA [Frankliniella fusca]|uniref:Nonribosomal peptide synthase agiA n=1 Tax=Frankliniella fusca TaxID=407009 RepID=A0AAE1H5J7_9NEOP|nr:Nonribosomal peptide synthase agiA [Frankliniella fusca]
MVYKILSKEIFGSEKHHRLLRQSLAAYIKEKWPLLYPGWRGLPSGETLCAIAAERLAAGKGSWSEALHVAAHLYDRQIHVIGKIGVLQTYGRTTNYPLLVEISEEALKKTLKIPENGYHMDDAPYATSPRTANAPHQSARAPAPRALTPANGAPAPAAASARSATVQLASPTAALSPCSSLGCVSRKVSDSPERTQHHSSLDLPEYDYHMARASHATSPWTPAAPHQSASAPAPTTLTPARGAPAPTGPAPAAAASAPSASAHLASAPAALRPWSGFGRGEASVSPECIQHPEPDIEGNPDGACPSRFARSGGCPGAADWKALGAPTQLCHGGVPSAPPSVLVQPSISPGMKSLPRRRRRSSGGGRPSSNGSTANDDDDHGDDAEALPSASRHPTSHAATATGHFLIACDGQRSAPTPSETSSDLSAKTICDFSGRSLHLSKKMTVRDFAIWTVRTSAKDAHEKITKRKLKAIFGLTVKFCETLALFNGQWVETAECLRSFFKEQELDLIQKNFVLFDKIFSFVKNICRENLRFTENV